MKKYMLLLAFAFLFSGCYYSSLVDLQKSKRDSGKVITYKESFNSIEKKVGKYMAGCFNRGIISFTTAVPTAIISGKKEDITRYEKKEIENGILYYVHIKGEFYVLGVEITPKDGKNTNLKLYANNISWQTRFSDIDNYIKTGELDCN